MKQQQPELYTLHGTSETFIKLPGLTMPFYHTEPLLYKIRLEGKCHLNFPSPKWLYLHLMIDDYLLYVNKFLPNTANRYLYILAIQTTIMVTMLVVCIGIQIHQQWQCVVSLILFI